MGLLNKKGVQNPYWVLTDELGVWDYSVKWVKKGKIKVI